VGRNRNRRTIPRSSVFPAPLLKQVTNEIAARAADAVSATADGGSTPLVVTRVAKGLKAAVFARRNHDSRSSRGLAESRRDDDELSPR
jgi:hypothetical protein